MAEVEPPPMAEAVAVVGVPAVLVEVADTPQLQAVEAVELMDAARLSSRTFKTRTRYAVRL